MGLDPAELLGAFTGNDAARVKVAGATTSAVYRIQDKVSQKATILGQLLGNKLGTPVFDALQKGAKAGSQKSVDDLARQQTGVTVTQVKSYGLFGGVVAAVVLLGYLVWRRLKGA